MTEETKQPVPAVEQKLEDVTLSGELFQETMNFLAELPWKVSAGILSKLIRSQQPEKPEGQ